MKPLTNKKPLMLMQLAERNSRKNAPLILVISLALIPVGSAQQRPHSRQSLFSKQTTSARNTTQHGYVIPANHPQQIDSAPMTPIVG